MFAAFVALMQVTTAAEPSVGDVLTDISSPVGQRVQGKSRPVFVDDQGKLVFKGWTRQSHGQWDPFTLSYAQAVRGVNCCVSVFTRGRSLILAISRPIARLPNGRVASEVITLARRYNLTQHEGWASACVDRGHTYDLAIVDKATGRARLIAVSRTEIQEKIVVLESPSIFDGSECSDLNALN